MEQAVGEQDFRVRRAVRRAAIQQRGGAAGFAGSTTPAAMSQEFTWCAQKESIRPAATVVGA